MRTEYEDYIKNMIDDYNVYYKNEKKEPNYRDFSKFLASLYPIDLTIEQFEKMTEGEKIEFRRNFKLNQLFK